MPEQESTNGRFPARNYRGGGQLTPNLGRARQLRHQSSDAELRLWAHLRSSQLEGLKFLRQHPFGSFILDFYCPSLKLAIELDGGQHATDKGMEADEKRTSYLEHLGVRVLRFSDYDALTNTDGVIVEILKAARCYRAYE
jgi:very-short-patch-repair endonuclease